MRFRECTLHSLRGSPEDPLPSMRGSGLANAAYPLALPSRSLHTTKMATSLFLFLTPPLSLTLKPPPHLSPLLHSRSLRLSLPIRQRGPPPPSYQVTIEHEGSTQTLEVSPDESILERALDEGMSVPHDCKLGVCMTCPARLISGNVDQSDGMLSDDVVDRGYALLCASYPRSDCHIKIIPEEELLSLQLATADD